MELFNDLDDLVEAELVDMVHLANRGPRRYHIRPRTNHFNKWNEREFVNRFRISKRTVSDLLLKIQHRLEHQTDRNHVVSPLDQFLLTLRFLATGSFYIAAGDFLGVHKSTAGKIVHRVVNALVELREEYITFPTDLADKQVIVTEFGSIARFPRVLGALDCTHVKLLSPGGPHAELFRNRKGYFSINVQGVCNAKTQLMDVVARWPGSAHDTHIFNNSAVRMRFESGEMGDMLLLGDSGYPVKEYLLTPLNNPQTPAENLYNESQIRTRNVVERTFGIWKRRFPILSTGLRCRLPLAQKIIIATAIIHNIACTTSYDLLEEEVDEGQLPIDEDEARHGGDDRIRRSMIAYFQNLL